MASRQDKINEVIAKLPQDFKTYGDLFAVSNRIQAAGDKFLDDITMRQQYLLVCLSIFGNYAPTLQELATVFGSSYQNVKRMAAQLERHGYLDINKDAIDKRKIRIVLNEEKFDQLREETARENNDFIDRLFEGVSPEDRTVVATALKVMQNNLDDIEKEFN